MMALAKFCGASKPGKELGGKIVEGMSKAYRRKYDQLAGGEQENWPKRESRISPVMMRRLEMQKEVDERKELMVIAKKYDKDNSGNLDASEIGTLIKELDERKELMVIAKK